MSNDITLIKQTLAAYCHRLDRGTADEVADTSSLAVLWQCGVKLIAGAFLSESSQVLAQ